MKTCLILAVFFIVATVQAQTITIRPEPVRTPFRLITSEPVVQVPSLTFRMDKGGAVRIPMVGTVPGRIFLGTLVTAGTQNGTFQLDSGSLVDAAKNKGDEITSGARLRLPVKKITVGCILVSIRNSKGIQNE